MNQVIRAFGILLVLAPIASLAGGCATSATQEAFASPDDAVNALVAAARSDSTDELKKIFGPESQPLVSSGDEVADRNSASRFAAAYDLNHRLETNPDGSVTLIVGEKDWPFPVPIVKDAKGWMFDTDAGMDELVSRRIGRNELSTIQTCLAIGDAQREYAIIDPDGNGVPEYARRFLSQPGTRDGLYWHVKDGEAPSPLGELVAVAEAEGYSSARAPDAAPQPYHGYYYRVLTSQGSAATGGAYDYEVNGLLIGGFGVVAYPAEYGNSGIMTFITNQQGVVYQRDLGDDTFQIAGTMTSFDPSPGWAPVEAVEPTP